MTAFFENKDASIICPSCKRLLTKADSKDKRKHRLLCRRCRSYICYVPSSGYAEEIPLPTRNQASGMRFY